MIGGNVPYTCLKQQGSMLPPDTWNPAFLNICLLQPVYLDHCLADSVGDAGY